MNPSHDHAFHRVRVLLLALLAVLTACALAGLNPAPAGAHDQLLSSSPAEGEQLPRAPEAAELTFSGQISPVGAELALSDASGQRIELPEAPRVEGTTATQPLPRLAAGEFTLDWRVVSEDGHPVSGTITFSVDPGETGEPESAQQPAHETGTAAPADSSEPGASGGPGASDEQGASGSLPVWLVALIGGIVGGVTVFLLNRRRRNRS